MAKAITPKKAANLLTRKRGRPAGDKNKSKQPIEEFKFPDEVEPSTPLPSTPK